MPTSHIRKVKLDITKLDKLEEKLLRRFQALQIRIYTVRKMKEGLKAATIIAAAPVPVQQGESVTAEEKGA